MNTSRTSFSDDRGEVASWLILMAGLALAATIAATTLGGVIESLANNVGGQSASAAGGAPATTVLADGSVVLADGSVKLPDGTIVLADGTVVYLDGSVILADGTVHQADGTIVYPDGTIELPDGTIGKPNGTIIFPDGTYYVPQQEIPAHLENIFDEIIAEIDRGDDLGMFPIEFDTVAELLDSLEAPDREAIIAALSEEQLERLFNNADSSGFWSDDLSDKQRGNFYTLLRDLSPDQQERLAPFTDYFELYDSTLNPINVRVPETEFVASYEAIIAMDIDEFLALRAYLWDNPELIADSPFDWYADGCSVPGGQYPGYLNGPCLRHDFAYRNVRIAAEHYGPDYQDVDAGGIAEEWKQSADQQLRDDIGEDLDDTDPIAYLIYGGVAIDFPIGPSGKNAWQLPYDSFYGPGYDPDLGQWPDEWYDSYRLGTLVDLATAGGGQ